MMQVADILEIPVIVTEQNSKVFGNTLPSI